MSAPGVKNAQDPAPPQLILVCAVRAIVARTTLYFLRNGTQIGTRMMLATMHTEITLAIAFSIGIASSYDSAQNEGKPLSDSLLKRNNGSFGIARPSIPSPIVISGSQSSHASPNGPTAPIDRMAMIHAPTRASDTLKNPFARFTYFSSPSNINKTTDATRDICPMTTT